MVDPTATAATRRRVLQALGIGALAPGALATATDRDETPSAGEPVVLQYFHEKWTTITDDLDRVADRGYDAIWIQQPAHNDLDWTDQEGRNDPPLGYQPLDLRSFDSALGSEADLRTLIETAHEAGVEVYVDTVMNHMATGQEPKYDFPQFGYDDFHHDPDPTEETRELYGLPDLKQESPYVREQLRNYMAKIADLGADGYRFDAAKHIPERFFEEYANRWADEWDMFRVGEVWNDSVEYVQEYVDQGPGMHAFDFPLRSVLADVFDGGDMRRLRGAGLVAQDPFHAMPFVENHDVDAPSQYKLAHAFVLTIEGYPVVYNRYPDWVLSDDDITNMVWVKTNLAGGQTRWRHADRDLLVYERADHLLVGLNNGGSARTVTVQTSWSGTELNDYAGTASNVTTEADGSVEITVPAGGWTFYAPVDATDPDPQPTPPTASFSYAPENPTARETVTFDASDSADPDGGVATYAWDFDGDGSAEGDGRRATHTFDRGGTYEVALTVGDGDDATADDTATRTVTVEAAPSAVERYDADGDGCIDVDELDEAMDDHVRGDLSEDELDAVLEAYFECL
jgi:alpha-amylase